LLRAKAKTLPACISGGAINPADGCWSSPDEEIRKQGAALWVYLQRFWCRLSRQPQKV
jgi:hypothetical protein